MRSSFVRLTIVTLISFASKGVIGASVAWDLFSCDKFAENMYSVYWYGEGENSKGETWMATPEVVVDVSFNHHQATLTGVNGNVGGNDSIWLHAIADEVVSMETFSSASAVFFEAGSRFAGDYSVVIGMGETEYFAIKSYGAVGWVELLNTGDEIKIASSMLDFDGGPVVVGGDAIPEPSTAWLLMFGCAGLALRRRRGCQR